MLLGILLTVMGLQFVTMGLLGELLVRTYHESQNKPVYRIDDDPASSRRAGPPGDGLCGRAEYAASSATPAVRRAGGD